MKLIFHSLIVAASLLSLSATTVSAHVIVKPATVKPNTYQTFSMSVPTEGKAATVKIRLIIPDGLTDVTPNVKPGWKITGKYDRITPTVVTELTWTGGEIPPGFRDEFAFSAKTPASDSKLAWKAFVTTADGVEAPWDAEPVQNQSMTMDADDVGNGGPYSVTSVVTEPATPPKDTNRIPTLVMVSLAMSAIALAVALFKSRF